MHWDREDKEESETVSLQRLRNPPNPPKQGAPEPGCQTSPKECIREDKEDSETVSPQRPRNPQILRNRELQSQDAKRHLRNALR